MITFLSKRSRSVGSFDREFTPFSALIFVILRAAVYSFVFSSITIKIVTRLMGLLLAAIAVQFVLNGIIHATHWG